MRAAKHFFMEPFCELCHTGDQKSSITFHSKSVRLILRGADIANPTPWASLHHG
jgi:hypothetical protein